MLHQNVPDEVRPIAAETKSLVCIYYFKREGSVLNPNPKLELDPEPCLILNPEPDLDQEKCFTGSRSDHPCKGWDPDPDPDPLIARPHTSSRG